jgi:hypothetical protein
MLEIVFMITFMITIGSSILEIWTASYSHKPVHTIANLSFTIAAPLWTTSVSVFSDVVKYCKNKFHSDRRWPTGEHRSCKGHHMRCTPPYWLTRPVLMVQVSHLNGKGPEPARSSPESTSDRKIRAISRAATTAERDNAKFLHIKLSRVLTFWTIVLRTGCTLSVN